MKNLLLILFVAGLVVGCSSPAQKYFDTGLELMEQEQYEEAIPLFDKALERSVDFPDVNANRAVCYMFLGEYDKAVKDFDVALKAVPMDEVTIYNRAQCKLAMEDYSGAIEDLSWVLQLLSQHYEAIKDRAYAYFHNEQYEEAIVDVNRALSMNPKDTFVLMLKGSATYELENYEEACESWELAASYGAKDGVAYLEEYCQEQPSISNPVDSLMKFATSLSIPEGERGVLPNFYEEVIAASLQKDKEATELYLTLILLKVYKSHLYCCNQSYDLRNNTMELNNVILKYYLQLTNQIDTSKPMEFISSAIVYDWVEMKEELKSDQQISRLMKQIKVKLNKIEKGEI